jgi:diaminopropionate ammonia-lyase
MDKDILWEVNINSEPKENIVNETFAKIYMEKDAMNFHKSFEEYKETPLWCLKCYAKEKGIKNLYVKDESYRFGLNSFKVLGGSYAIGKVIAKKLNKDISKISFGYLKSNEWKKEIEKIILATATDGNHGRGVAWTAKQLGLEAKIYMPFGSTENRLNHIKNLGAEAYITDMNYDDTVRYVVEQAKENNWTVIQDTAWEGYKEVPKWIMQGYSTLAKEIIDQVGDNIPTHVFLQAGVGAFASVIASILTAYYVEEAPKIIIVEPRNAACFYESIKNDKLTNVTGKMETIMAGLACGEPNPLGYEILSKYGHIFISASDEMAKRGMRLLYNPKGSDMKIISGESGAVGLGVLDEILTNKEYAELKEILELDEESTILIISTEGNTDPDMYKIIVGE